MGLIFIQVRAVKISEIQKMFQFWKHVPSRHLLVQSQQGKHSNNVWNLFKVNNKDNSVFIVNFEQISRIVLVFSLLTLNK